MKRKILTLLATRMFISTPVYASADIDISSLSVEQLIDLRSKINAVIAENGGDNLIGMGKYVVGIEIKEGTFSFQCTKNAQYGFINVLTYPSQEEYDKRHSGEADSEYEVSQLYYNEEEPDNQNSATVKLTKGMVLELSDEAIIQEINPSWGVN